MKSSFFLSLFFAGAALLPATPINISGTGVAYTNAGIDKNYTVTTTTDPTVKPGPAYLANNWGAPLAGTHWIEPLGGDCNGNFGNYSYTYSTSFNLAGLNAASAVLTGTLFADDSVTLFLNGHQVSPSNFGTYTQATNFTIGSPYSSFFNAGVNTLAFQVLNSGGGPTGLDVSVSGTANAAVAATPEPGTIGLSLSAGLAMVGFGLTRRRKQTSEV